MAYTGMFAGRALKGRDWVRQLSDEDRKIWASLGRRRLSEMDKNWHYLGGKKQAKVGRRDKRGRFIKAEVTHG